MSVFAAFADVGQFFLAILRFVWFVGVPAQTIVVAAFVAGLMINKEISRKVKVAIILVVCLLVGLYLPAYHASRISWGFDPGGAAARSANPGSWGNTLAILFVLAILGFFVEFLLFCPGLTYIGDRVSGRRGF